MNIALSEFLKSSLAAGSTETMRKPSRSLLKSAPLHGVNPDRVEIRRSDEGRTREWRAGDDGGGIRVENGWRVSGMAAAKLGECGATPIDGPARTWLDAMHLGPGRRHRGLPVKTPAAAAACYAVSPKNEKPAADAAGFRQALPSRKNWSGRRDSNPRPRPWQGRALPLSYTRIRVADDRSPATGRAMPNAARECNSRARGRCRPVNRP